jgi:hypothetical protein
VGIHHDTLAVCSAASPITHINCIAELRPETSTAPGRAPLPDRPLSSTSRRRSKLDAYHESFGPVVAFRAFERGEAGFAMSARAIN